MSLRVTLFERSALAQAIPGMRAGLLLTAAAQFEAGESVGAPDDAIVLRISLENRTSSAMSALALRVTAPAGVRAELDPRAASNQTVPLFERNAIDWRDIAVGRGERVALPAVRLAPAAGLDGARLFREATLRAVLSGTVPTEAVLAPPLPLAGLWGDFGLRRTALPAGVTVLSRERPELALASLALAVGAGARDGEEFGCAAAVALATALAGVGHGESRPPLAGPAVAPAPSLAVTVQPASTVYRAELPTARLASVLAAFVEHVTDEGALAAALSRTRGAAAKEQTRRMQTAALRADDEFFDLVFDAPPNRRPPGALGCAPTITHAQALALARDAYVATNVTVSIVGPLTHDQAVALVSRAVAALPSAAQRQPLALAQPPQQDRRIVQLGSGDGALQLRLGWPAPPPGGQDGAATALIAAWLERASGVEARYLPFSNRAALRFAAEAESLAQGDNLVALCLGLVQQLRDGPIDQRSLDAAVNDAVRRETIDENAGAGIAALALTGMLQSPDEWSASLRAVRAADLQRVALRWFGSNTYSLVRLRTRALAEDGAGPP